MSKELREEFNQVKAEAVEIINKAKGEKRDLTGEEREANEKRFARLDEIKRVLADEKRVAELTIEQFAADVMNVAKAGHEPKAKAEAVAAGDREQYEAHRKAVNQYIRTGQIREEFTLTTGTGSNVLLPKLVTPPTEIRRLTNAVVAAVVARGLMPLYTDGTESISIPVWDDSSNDAANTAEDASGETTQDPSTSGITLGATLYDSKAVWFSNSLLNANAFDLLGYVEPMLQKRIDHKMQAVFTAALVAGTVGKTTASTTGVTYAELLDWEHSLGPAYRTDLVYLISDGLFKALRSLTDDNNRPIYQESLLASEPDKLFGKPVFVCDSLEDPAAGKVTGVAASAEALKIRIVNNRRIVRYNAVPNHPDQFGLQMFQNAGFGFVSNGVRTLKQAAA